MSLKAENLSFSYENGGRHVLTRISLKIEPGERVGLVAPSGYGKTTLCRLLAGYERPEEGTVEIDSIPIENIRGCMPVQLIWQHPEQALNPRWRMRQVLSEGGQVDEESRGRLGIREEWLDRFPSELSGGELQRFCIARALARPGQERRWVCVRLWCCCWCSTWKFLPLSDGKCSSRPFYAGRGRVCQKLF